MLRHFVEPQVVVEVYGGERVHDDVVDELQVVSFFPVRQVLREDNVQNRGQDHVDHNENHQRVEVARTPVEREQHEGQQPRNHLQQLRHRECRNIGFD